MDGRYFQKNDSLYEEMFKKGTTLSKSELSRIVDVIKKNWKCFEKSPFNCSSLCLNSK